MALHSGGRIAEPGYPGGDFNFTGPSITQRASSYDFSSGGITVMVTTPSGQVSANGYRVGVKDGGLDLNGSAYGQFLTLSFSQAVNVGGIGFGYWNYATVLHDKADVSYNGTSEIFQNTTAFDLFCHGTQAVGCYSLNGGLGNRPDKFADGYRCRKCAVAEFLRERAL